MLTILTDQIRRASASLMSENRRLAQVTDELMVPITQSVFSL